VDPELQQTQTTGLDRDYEAELKELKQSIEYKEVDVSTHLKIILHGKVILYS
jgi:hypothetical protein